MPKVLQIKAEPLTAEAYRPFGQVIGMDKVQMKIVNDRSGWGSPLCNASLSASRI
jgi:ureidoglycolate hydrolase